MKLTKLHKLCFALAVAAITGFMVANDTNAAYKHSGDYTIKDMMQRRSKGVAYNTKKAKKSKTFKKRTTPVVAKADVNTTKTASVKDVNVEKVSEKTSDFLDFNSGPLFDTGSCSASNQSGPLFDAGPCQRCPSGPLIDTGPCETCEQPELRVANYTVDYKDYIYKAVSRNCCDMAPIYLEHVDFNLSDKSDYLPYANKMGNYRFRIFGCRRYDKEAILNKGRILEKNMNFTKVFEDVTSDCYNIVKIPQDLCLQDTPTELPEYVLTAEITDFFMNVCDGYDWKESKKADKRTGSAEIKVLWRLSNLTKTNVVWEGETTGYSDLEKGDENGEIELVEKAFADAVKNLRNEAGFEDKLLVRLTPEELTREREALIDEEIALDPVKCQFKKEQDLAKNCQISRVDADIMQCPAVVEQTIVINKCAECEACPECAECEVCPPKIIEDAGVIIAHSVIETPTITQDSGVHTDNIIFKNCIDENGGVVSGGDCVVVDDTWIDMKNGDTTFDSLCIVDRPAYDILSPENLYKVRASIIEIQNAANKKAAGLIVSENFVITSADIVEKDSNIYNLKTINGKELTGRAVRVNLSKNTALIMLDENTEYTPLSLNLDLPKVGQTGYLTLGVLDVDNFEDGENYIDNNGKITGYRYSEDKGSEIIVDTFVQNLTIGGVLIDGHGTINGMSHIDKKTENGMDLFLPTETVLRSLGLSICEKLYEKNSPWQQTIYKPVTELILKSKPKAPEEMKVEERK